MASVDYLFVAQLDDSGVQKTLDAIDKRIDQIANSAAESFNLLELEGVTAFSKIRNAVKQSSGEFNNATNQVKELRKEIQGLTGDLKGVKTIKIDAKLTGKSKSTETETTPTQPMDVGERFLAEIAQEEVQSLEQVKMLQEQISNEGLAYYRAKQGLEETTSNEQIQNLNELEQHETEYRQGVQQANRIQLQQVKEQIAYTERLAQIEQQRSQTAEETAISATGDIERDPLVSATSTELQRGRTQDVKSFIQQSDEASQTIDEFKQLASISESVTDQQLELAENIAKSRLQVEELVKQYRQTPEVQGEIKRLEQDIEEQTALYLKSVREGNKAVKDSVETERERQNVIKKTAEEALKLQAKLEKADLKYQQERQKEVTKTAEQELKLQAKLEKAELQYQERRRKEIEQTAQYQLQILAKIEQAEAKSRQRAGQGAVQYIKDFPKVESAIRGLIKQYGQLEIRLDKNGNALNEQSQEFLQVVSKSKVLQYNIEQLAREFGGLETRIDSLDLNDPFKEGSKNAGNFAGIIKGSVVGAVISLGLVLQNVGRIAFDTFKQITTEASKTAAEFENTEIAFRGIFEGDVDKANQLFETTRDLSRRFGSDVSALVVSLAPFVESSDQLERFAEAAVELSNLPNSIAQGQDIGDAVVALIELISGDPRSLQKRYEISLTETQNIKDQIEQFGLEGGLVELEKVLAARGADFAAFENTIRTVQGRVKEFGRDLLAASGQPVNEALVDFFNRLTNILEDNEYAISQVTTAVGDVLAAIIEVGQEILFENLDLTDISDLSTSIENIATAIRDSKDDLQGWIDDLNNVSQTFDNLTSFLDPAIARFEKLPELFQFLEDGLKKLILLINPLTAAFALWDTYGDIFEFGAGQSFSEFTKETTGGIAGVAALGVAATSSNKELKDLFNQFKDGEITLNSFLDEASRFEETAGLIESFRSSLGIEQSVLSAPIDKPVEQEDDLFAGRTEQKITEEKKKELEDRQKIIEDILKKRLEIEKKFAQDQIKLEIENAQKREEIERKLSDKLDDILQDYYDKIEDALTDFNDKIEDINDDFNEDQIKQQKEAADKRAEIWKEYYRKLEDLQRQFDFDASEAIRQNDAIRFLQLRRRLQFEQNEARVARDRDLADATDDEDKKNQELEDKRKKAIDDAQKDLDRQLRDAKTAYDRGVRDAELARDRDLRDLQETNQQKLEEMKRQYELELEEFDLFVAEKEGRTLDYLNGELSLINELNNQILDKESDIYKLRLTEFGNFITGYKAELEELNLVYSKLNNTLVSGYGGYGTLPSAEKNGSNGSESLTSETDKSYQSRLVKQAIGVYNFKNPRPNNDFIKELQTYDIEKLLKFISSAGVTPLKRKTVKARKMGGSVLAQNTYLVGEQGAELLTIGQGFNGRITPIRDPNNFTIPSYPLGGNSVNNSRNYNVDLSMLNPDALSPGQIAQITAIVQQVLLQATA